jgi:hypothetical protein
VGSVVIGRGASILCFFLGGWFCKMMQERSIWPCFCNECMLVRIFGGEVGFLAWLIGRVRKMSWLCRVWALQACFEEVCVGNRGYCVHCIFLYRLVFVLFDKLGIMTC